MPRPRSGGGAIYVAAANAPARVKAWADYVCDGVDDQVEIQAAINTLYTSRPVPWNQGAGGRVELSAGVFNVTAPIDIVGNVSLVGQNVNATMIRNAAPNPIHIVRWRPGMLVDNGVFVSWDPGTKTLVLSGISVTANQLAGKYLRIKRGLCAGEKRQVTSNAATSNGLTSIVLSSGFSSTPDETSVFCVDNTREFNAELHELLLSGNRYASNNTSGVKAIRSRSVGSQTDATWVDDGTNMVYIDGSPVSGGFPAWVVGCAIYVYDGTGKGQMRYIEGRATTTNTNDTLLLDGPWWPALDGTSKAYIGAPALGLWGPNTSDMVVSHIFCTECSGWGVSADYTWGFKWFGGYIEFCDLGGLYVSQPPLYVAVTGTWNRSTTTGQQASVGPTIVGVKIVGNGRRAATSEGGHGVMIYGRVMDTKIIGCELGSDHENFDGLYTEGGYGGTVAACSVAGGTCSSWDNSGGGSPNNAAYHLGPNTRQCTITGVTVRLDATVGPKNAIKIDSGAYGNNVVGNTWGAAGSISVYSLADGRNRVQGNLNSESREQDVFMGWIRDVWNGTSIVFTYPRPLFSKASDADWIVLLTPRDTQTARKHWAASAIDNTQLQILSTDASTGTTTTEAVPGAGTYTIGVVSSAEFLADGQAVIDTGANAETVTIVSVPDATHIRAAFTKAHASGVTLKPCYRFWARVESESLITGNG